MKFVAPILVTVLSTVLFSGCASVLERESTKQNFENISTLGERYRVYVKNDESMHELVKQSEYELIDSSIELAKQMKEKAKKD